MIYRWERSIGLSNFSVSLSINSIQTVQNRSMKFNETVSRRNESIFVPRSREIRRTIDTCSLSSPRGEKNRANEKNGKFVPHPVNLYPPATGDNFILLATLIFSFYSGRIRQRSPVIQNANSLNRPLRIFLAIYIYIHRVYIYIRVVYISN